jgi:hypothetical protein
MRPWNGRRGVGRGQACIGHPRDRSTSVGSDAGCRESIRRITSSNDNAGGDRRSKRRRCGLSGIATCLDASPALVSAKLENTSIADGMWDVANRLHAPDARTVRRNHRPLDHYLLFDRRT